MYDKLNINVHNLNTVLTNNYANISKKIKSKKLKLHKSCLNLDKIRDSKLNKSNERETLTKKIYFIKEIRNMSGFRTLTHAEEKERDHRKVEQEKLKRHYIKNYRFMINTTKTARANSIRIIGNKCKQEHFNKCKNMAFHDITAHDKSTMETQKY